MPEKEKESNFNWYKYCFVPECKSTVITAPEKVFLNVPSNPLKRKLWCEAVGYPDKKLRKVSHICEDHFDLKEDLQNYLQWKMMGSPKIFKPNVVPHLCLNNAPKDALSSISSNVVLCDTENPLPSTSLSGVEKATSHDESLNQCISSAEVKCSSSKVSSCDTADLQTSLTVSEELISTELHVPVITTKSHQNQSTQCQIDVEHVHVQAQVSTLVKSTQTYKQKSKKPALCASVIVTCDIEPFTLPAIQKLSINEARLDDTIDSVCSGVLDSSLSYVPSTEKTSSNSEMCNLQLQALRESVYEKYTKIIIEDNPSLFIGVKKESMYLIDLLHEASSISVRNIYLTLKKIKTNLSFAALAYEFSVSESQADRIFKSSVHIIAKYCKELIVWPSTNDILINLPMQFRFRYSDVQSTIDCFEIEIEKPSDAVNQALTWSDYKKCNTAKYLISVTPDGTINYISEGVCGRSSDMAIVENCGYLEKLPPNTAVLADRGFKQLDTILSKKQCKLIRPPSVKQDVKSTKKEVKLTKQIASIRIHVERVINRIRNFQLLNIHTRVDNNLLDCLDSCVFIAAGLVNMQSEIIKQC